MRMKEKGLSTGAIVAIVVVVIVAVVGSIAAVLLLAPGALGVGTTGIEAKPGSTKCDGIGGASGSSFLSSMSTMAGGTSVSEATLAGISMDIYTTSDDAITVVDWYKSKWSGEGYTENVYETVDFSQIPGASTYGFSGSMGVVIYQKGDQMVGVIAMSYQNETYYILFSASMSALEALVNAYSGESSGGDGAGGEPPTSDVSGSDISDIPRYTGSVRTYYGELYGTTFIYYVTSASTSTVADFYATQLPANGWTVGGTTSIFATKGSAIASIEIKVSSEYSGYTEIQIAYYPG